MIKHIWRVLYNQDYNRSDLCFNVDHGPFMCTHQIHISVPVKLGKTQAFVSISILSDGADQEKIALKKIPALL